MEALKQQYKRIEEELAACGRAICKELLERRTPADSSFQISEELQAYLQYNQTAFIHADVVEDESDMFEIDLETSDKDFPEQHVVDFLSYYGETEYVGGCGTTTGYHYTYKVMRRVPVSVNDNEGSELGESTNDI